MFQTCHRLAVAIVVAAALTSIPAFAALAQQGAAPLHVGDRMQKMPSATQNGGSGIHQKMNAAGKRPYTGMETRKIKALSEARIEGLLSGKGIGYALAAELNKYPGPRHVLDMAETLGLSDQQKNKIQILFDGMQAEAVALGRMIVDKEAALDRAFADAKIDPVSLEAMVAAIARREGQLRTVHLTTHLEMKSVLSSQQVMLYDRSRGYSAKAGNARDHRMR